MQKQAMSTSNPPPFVHFHQQHSYTLLPSSRPTKKERHSMAAATRTIIVRCNGVERIAKKVVRKDILPILNKDITKIAESLISASHITTFAGHEKLILLDWGAKHRFENGCPRAMAGTTRTSISNSTQMPKSILLVTWLHDTLTINTSRPSSPLTPKDVPC
ncbi:hypothetical protein CPB84DRAFT_1761215 [Gymnopilus junonius]|uniref:Uncharacterized protein n=1 Tax=Gymnopilus junonius TaxID=109634 RepID=A0A9P5P1E9_GYMJU|nr:hypothetical protein CPB84DRAFT_1761215 [Gymnopilus junonius]